MNKLYFHPGTSSKNRSPVFSDSNQYDSVRHFLRAIEILEPKAIIDLKELVPLYEEVENNEEIQRDWDEWDVLNTATEMHNSYLIPLRESVKSWALKYNLTDPDCNHSLYMVIAIWALGTLSTHDEFVQDMIRIGKEVERPVPINLIKWSLIDAIYFETEEDDIRLEESAGKGDFSKRFPFVFSPGPLTTDFFYSEKVQLRNKETIDVSDFEELLYFFGIAQFRQDKPYFAWNGKAWDPRREQWQEFEKGIDAAFNAYKKKYKERTEMFMKENGYIVGPEKRNIEHFQWLVRYQIQGWKLHQIADWYSNENKTISEDAVYKAIKSTASLVSIPLRS